MPSYPIIDSHFHLFDIPAVDYPWMGDAPRRLNARQTMTGYLAASKGLNIESSIFVEVNAAEGSHLAEASFAQQQADASGKIGGIVARAPVEKGEAVADDLELLLGNSKLRGIRRGVRSLDMALDPKFIAGVKAVGHHGLVFDIGVVHWAVMFGIELARRCPEVPFVLDHFGTPPIKHGVIDPWWQQMRDFAALPNVKAKVSGMLSGVDPKNWHQWQVRPYLEHAIECFGFDRIMFGSDWPMLSDASSIGGWLSLVEETVAFATDEEKRQLFRGNAIETYRLEPGL